MIKVNAHPNRGEFLKHRQQLRGDDVEHPGRAQRHGGGERLQDARVPVHRVPQGPDLDRVRGATRQDKGSEEPGDPAERDVLAPADQFLLQFQSWEQRALHEGQQSHLRVSLPLRAESHSLIFFRR